MRQRKSWDRRKILGRRPRCTARGVLTANLRINLALATPCVRPEVFQAPQLPFDSRFRYYPAAAPLQLTAVAFRSGSMSSSTEGGAGRRRTLSLIFAPPSAWIGA